jgi:translation initiation factor 2D
MFHKESSIHGGGGSGSGSKKKAMDVPVRKSDRRQLRQRVGSFFRTQQQHQHQQQQQQQQDDEINSNEQNDKTIVPDSGTTTTSGTDDGRNGKEDEQQQQQPPTPVTSSSSSTSSPLSTLERMLDEIFLNGNLAVRTLSLQGGGTMMLYLKTPTPTIPTNNISTNTSTSSSTTTIPMCWPYMSSTQFVWMTLLDGTRKGGGGGGGGNTNTNNTTTTNILHETPTVAVWAVLFSLIDSSILLSNYVVVIPSAASKYLCNGADLMKAGILHIPTTATRTATISSSSGTKGITNNHHHQPQSSSGKQPGDHHNAKKSGGGNNNQPILKQQQPHQNNKLFKPNATDFMVAICVKGNPQPFAVGVCKIDPNGNHSNSNNTPVLLYGPNTKGVGVEIWNCYGDDIWKSSYTQEQRKCTHSRNGMGGGNAPYDNGHYGNIGFIDGKYIVPIINTTSLLQPTRTTVSGESDNEDEDDDDEDDDDDEQVSTTGKDTQIDEKMNLVAHTSNQSTTRTTETTPVEDNRNANHAVQILNDGDEATTSPDTILHHAVCQALVNLKNKDLPMIVGTFYTQHVLPNRPIGTMIDLKATTYKKFGTYLKEQVKNELLSVGPDPAIKVSSKNNPDPMALLKSYNKKHPDLVGMTKVDPPSSSSFSTGGGRTTFSGTDKNRPTKLVMVKLHIIPTHWIALLRLDTDDVLATDATSVERRGTGMLTTPEVRAILDTYIEREDLTNRETVPPGFVLLDGPLTDALYGKKKQQQQDSTTTAPIPPPPDRLSRKDIVPLFTSKLLAAYALVEMPGSTITKLARGHPPPVEIEVTRRQTNKYVTRVRGLEEYGIDPNYLSRDMSKRLAVSSTIETDPTENGRAALSKKGYVEIVFGANIVDELEALLTGDESISNHGGVKDTSDYVTIPKDVIHVTLRKGVPARKKKSSSSGGAGGKKK